jgi:alpha-glucosidase
MPWKGGAPSLGFGPGDAAWLPQPPEYDVLAVDRQLDVADSTLELYRTLLHLRREMRLGLGTLTWYDAGSDEAVAFTTSVDDQTVLVLANLGPSPVPVPRGARVLVASTPEFSVDAGVPSDTTIWARIEPRD